MVFVNESSLELLLEKAARAHKRELQSAGATDPDWTSWYASFIMKRLREHDERD